MAIDTPAKIAILGAGPMGLEAALYARFLGYEVAIFDRGAAAENVRKLGDEPLREPFERLHSPLGLAAIEAQDENYVAPDVNALLSASEWIECYLQPLADTDLLADHLRLKTEVVAVERLETPEVEVDADEEPPPHFRVLARGAAGKKVSFEAHVVIDATGPAESQFLPAETPYFHRLSGATFLAGLNQIRERFAVIGDRAALDLYRGAVKLD